MRIPRSAAAFVCAASVGLLAGLTGVTTAHAAGAPSYDVLYSCAGVRSAPTMTFDKSSSAPYGTLYTYYSSTAYCGSQLTYTRRKVTMKAGSGNGSSNECASSAGWLPNASSKSPYTVRYEKNHQTASAVVKGSVWALSNRVCSNGKVTRTALFIHSQGGNGGSWTESNYKSLGCIKLNQTHRSYLASLYNMPIYGASKTTLSVTS